MGETVSRAENRTHSVAIIAETSTGLTRAEADALGVTLIPVPFTVNGEPFLQEVTLSHEEFYRRWPESADRRTSQPNLTVIAEAWQRALEEHDELVYFPISAGLSSSYESAARMAKEYGGRVEVANIYRASSPMRQSVEDALYLRSLGQSAAQIRQALDGNALAYSSYVLVDTLEPLKRGGRITPAAAAVATLLSVKPILTFGSGVLDIYAKARGSKRAKEMMLCALQNDLSGRFAEDVRHGAVRVFVAEADCREEAEALRAEIEARFPGLPPIRIDAAPLNIACHIGRGALGIFCVRCLSPVRKERE